MWPSRGVAERAGEFDERAWLARQGIHVVLRGSRGARSATAAASPGVGDRMRNRIEGAVGRGSRRGAAGARARRRPRRGRGAARSRPAGLSGVRASRISSPSPARTSPYSPSASTGSAGCSGCRRVVRELMTLDGDRRLRAGGRLAAVRRSAPESRARWRRSHGSRPGRATGGTSLRSERSCCSRGRRRRSSIPASSSRSPPSPGIFVGVPRLRARLDGYPVPARARDVLGVAVVCGLVTAPIVLFHFGEAPVYTVPANAVAFPAMPAVLGLGLLATAADPFSPAAATALAWLAGWAAAWLELVARVFGSLPGAQIDARTALVVMLVCAAAWVGSRHGRRGRLPRPEPLPLAAAASCSLRRRARGRCDHHPPGRRRRDFE